MARCQQTKGMGWQSAGSMKNTASLGLIKQRERDQERASACKRGGREARGIGEESKKEKEEKRGRKKPV